MDVVVARPVHDQQIALQLARKRDRRALFIFLRMVLWQPAVSLLVNRVVVMNVRHGRDGYASCINIGIAEHRIECRRTAAAPTPDRDPSRIDERPLRDRARRRSLVTRIHNAHLAIDDLAPRTATRRGCAAIVDAHHDVTMLREQLVPEIIPTKPRIEYGLS